MAAILSAVPIGGVDQEKDVDLLPIRRVLVSVSDKSNIAELIGALSAARTGESEFEILSTGGTAKKLRDSGFTVTDVSDYTNSPEILDGRVKTLHPKIHGGLLGVRGNEKHRREMTEQGIGSGIDLVVMNLYPFQATVAAGADFATCMENIDIGGPSMLRSSAKNHSYVAILTDPSQYDAFTQHIRCNGGCSTLAMRRQLAAQAFSLSASYDASISTYFSNYYTSLQQEPAAEGKNAELTQPPLMVVNKTYAPKLKLKYGSNPHQLPAALYSPLGGKLPFEVLNGTPGYINLLDACFAWQLVAELKKSLHPLPAAASFKHCSPAGAAVGVPLTAQEALAYEISDPSSLSPTALAYVRARNADPMCSFGDFAAISHTVDVSTAQVFKAEVCDGIIAPAFEPEALAILRAKKKGGFIILQVDEAFVPPESEFRELFGVVFSQRRNDVLFNASAHLQNVVVGGALLPADAQRDLTLASIAIKYTQSNSVGYALNGQMIGVGAGQQSRVDCVKLAGRKTAVWYLRQHPKVQSLPFKSTVKRQDRVNARVRYIEGDITAAEMPRWASNFESQPEPLLESEKLEFMKSLGGVSISSDAFFPFRDSIDHASKAGVQFIAQPGGSIADQELKDACSEYGMTMAFTNLRLFLH